MVKESSSRRARTPKIASGVGPLPLTSPSRTPTATDATAKEAPHAAGTHGVTSARLCIARGKAATTAALAKRSRATETVAISKPTSVGDPWSSARRAAWAHTRAHPSMAGGRTNPAAATTARAELGAPRHQIPRATSVHWRFGSKAAPTHATANPATVASGTSVAASPRTVAASGVCDSLDAFAPSTSATSAAPRTPPATASEGRASQPFTNFTLYHVRAEALRECEVRGVCRRVASFGGLSRGRRIVRLGVDLLDRRALSLERFEHWP